LCEYLDSKGVIQDGDYSALMGLGTDGASVMVGCHNGVGAKLKEKNEKLVQVHCIAYRLNQAASQASKNINYMQDYHRELQTLLHGVAKQVPEGTSVRWLWVESAVKMIFEHFDAIIMTLEYDKDKTGKASGIWKFMAISIFVLVTALLLDVLTCIGILSITFQKESVNLSAIRHNVDSAVSTMRTFRNGSPTVDSVLQELDLEAANDTRVTYKSVKILHNQNLTNKLNAVRRDFKDTLRDNLTTRFPHEELELLECFDIVFNPTRYPKEQS